jgi:uncharacterized repeat protein (TIGR04076 family)
MGNWTQRYGNKLELEVFEGDGCPYHEVGDIFKFPEDMGKVCPWLLDSAHSMMRSLMMGGTLPWDYRGTPYEKVFNEKDVTTEFVRCPDPTSAGIVVKIICHHK